MTRRVHDHADVDTRVHFVHRTLVNDFGLKRELEQDEGQYLLHNHLLHQRIK